MDDFELIFLSGAESDLVEIYSRYLDRSSEAADRFYDFTDFRIGLLHTSPELAPVYEPPTDDWSWDVIPTEFSIRLKIDES